MKKKEIKKLTKKQMTENLEKLKKDLFNFRFQKVNGQIKIYNTIWEEVYSSIKSDFKHSIDIQDLEAGIYLVEFNNSIKKLIKH